MGIQKSFCVAFQTWIKSVIHRSGFFSSCVYFLLFLFSFHSNQYDNGLNGLGTEKISLGLWQGGQLARRRRKRKGGRACNHRRRRFGHKVARLNGEEELTALSISPTYIYTHFRVVSSREGGGELGWRKSFLSSINPSNQPEVEQETRLRRG